jgi:hypothetical protein
MRSERMESACGSTALWRILGRAMRTETRSCCALLSVGAPNFKTSECGVRYAALYARDLAAEKGGCGLPVIAPWASPASEEFRIVQRQVSISIPRLLGHCFGAYATPGGTRSSASPKARPSGVSAPPGTSLRTAAETRRTNFFRVPPRKQTFGAWESRPLA